MATPTVIKLEPPITQERRLPMSFEEFLELPETMHAEWVDGEAIIFMTTTDVHADVAFFYARLIAEYVDEFRLGRVRTAPFGMRTRLDRPFREPDVMFIANRHFNRLARLWIDGPADLVFEVISDDSVGRDRHEKFDEYREGGVLEYWTYDPRPDKQRLDGHQLGENERYLAILPDDDGRYHSRVLPGFWLRLDWLTRDPLPRPKDALAEILASGGQTGDRSSTP